MFLFLAAFYKTLGGEWNNVLKVNASQFEYTENKFRAEYDRIHANNANYIPLGRRTTYDTIFD